MSDQTPQSEPPRMHPQDPAEGAEEAEDSPQPRAHTQEPAEGGDDSSATS